MYHQIFDTKCFCEMSPCSVYESQNKRKHDVEACTTYATRKKEEKSSKPGVVSNGSNKNEMTELY